MRVSQRQNQNSQTFRAVILPARKLDSKTAFKQSKGHGNYRCQIKHKKEESGVTNTNSTSHRVCQYCGGEQTHISYPDKGKKCKITHEVNGEAKHLMSEAKNCKIITPVSLRVQGQPLQYNQGVSF